MLQSHSASWTRLSDFTFTFHFHALEKEMATHSSVLAWRIPGMGEPGGLPSMGSHRVGHGKTRNNILLNKKHMMNFQKNMNSEDQRNDKKEKTVVSEKVTWGKVLLKCIAKEW